MSTSRTIPVWATKVVDATIKDEEFQTSTHQSANLFRIECGRIWMQRIYHAQREAWKKTVQSMLLVDTNYPTEKTSSPVVVPETEIPSWIMESYCIGVAPTENHNANTEESFPMTVVSPPPSCRLDRQAVTEAIWDYFRESDNGRCCSLWLPRLLPTLHGTLHLLARQCIQKPEQEDEVFEIQSMKHYRKHQKKRSTSMKQILLWWAARTSSYDSMVILLEVRQGVFSVGTTKNPFAV